MRVTVSGPLPVEGYDGPALRIVAHPDFKHRQPVVGVHVGVTIGGCVPATVFLVDALVEVAPAVEWIVRRWVRHLGTPYMKVIIHTVNLGTVVPWRKGQC